MILPNHSKPAAKYTSPADSTNTTSHGFYETEKHRERIHQLNGYKPLKKHLASKCNCKSSVYMPFKNLKSVENSVEAILFNSEGNDPFDEPNRHVNRAETKEIHSVQLLILKRSAQKQKAISAFLQQPTKHKASTERANHLKWLC